jgi:hypothetical protein
MGRASGRGAAVWAVPGGWLYRSGGSDSGNTDRTRGRLVGWVRSDAAAGKPAATRRQPSAAGLQRVRDRSHGGRVGWWLGSRLNRVD